MSKQTPKALSKIEARKNMSSYTDFDTSKALHSAGIVFDYDSCWLQVLGRYNHTSDSLRTKSFVEQFAIRYPEITLTSYPAYNFATLWQALPDEYDATLGCAELQMTKYENETTIRYYTKQEGFDADCGPEVKGTLAVDVVAAMLLELNALGVAIRGGPPGREITL